MLKKPMPNPQATKFCIVATQRTGSTWLCTLLDSHPDIRTFSEVFAPKTKNIDENNYFPSFQSFRQTCHNQTRFQNVFNYINLINNYPSNAEAIGFKLMYSHIRAYPELLIKLLISKYRLIHLIRENTLDIALSRKNAWSSKGNKIVHTSKGVKIDKIVVHPKSLVQQITSIQSEVKKAQLILSLFPIPVLTITYESLQSDTQATLSKITHFLKIENPDHPFSSKLRKISKGNYQDKIENYQSVQEVLEQNHLDYLLQD